MTTADQPTVPRRNSSATTLSKTAAQALTEMIKSTLSDLDKLIPQAWEGRADQVLGYASWDDYCDSEFYSRMVRLPVHVRRQSVRTLRELGMSTRAIGSALGVSKDTVHRDLASVSNETDEQDSTVVSLDGRRRPQRQPRREKPATVAPKQEAKPIKQETTADLPPLDWNTMPGNAKAKLEAMRRQIHKEYQRELDRHVEKLDAEVKSRVQAQIDTEANIFHNVMRNRLDRADRVLSGRKGIFSRADYDVIRSCLHPDSRTSVSDQKLANAFRLFNEADILLIKETETPTASSPPLPALDEIRRRMAERDAKRNK
jgi:hypothetical protein